MSEFRTVEGFEGVWRPPVRGRPRRPEEVLRSGPDHDVRARLARVVRRAPEVMVKVTGRTRDVAHLAAHVSYVLRNGDLVGESRDGAQIIGRQEARELVDDWATHAALDRRRANSPLSVSIILSMPAGTDALKLRNAATAFAAEEFADRCDYLLVLHTDTAHPHAHLTVRALDDEGSRLSPKKADLEAWRQAFARQLRAHGVEAEATPRRARGVTRKSERGPMRRMRERHRAGRGQLGRVAAAKLREAARLAYGGSAEATGWEQAIAVQQVRTRRLYLAQAKLLQASSAPDDRRLGVQVEAFIRDLAPPDTERLALARALRAAQSIEQEKDRS